MSALFFRLALATNVDRFRELQTLAKSRGGKLTVRNASRTRGLPIFLFYLDRRDGTTPTHFSSLDDAANAVGGKT